MFVFVLCLQKCVSVSSASARGDFPVHPLSPWECLGVCVCVCKSLCLCLFCVCKSVCQYPVLVLEVTSRYIPSLPGSVLVFVFVFAKVYVCVCFVFAKVCVRIQC